MAKKIAVVVRDRQAEAFRMAVGLTLDDDEVNVFVMDKKLDASDESVSLNVETCNDLDVKIYSNNPENNFEQMSTDDIARALVNYDSVLPY
jgi:hypothetical protein